MQTLNDPDNKMSQETTMVGTDARAPTTEDVITVIERVGRGLEATKPKRSGDPIMLLTNLAKRIKQLTEIHDALDSVRKQLNAEFDQLKLKEVPDLMIEMELRTFTVEGVGRVQVSGDVYASISAEKREEAYKWLRDNNYGDMIQETVNASSLKAWLKEGIQSGRATPEDLFKCTPYSKVSLVKVAAKKAKASKSE